MISVIITAFEQYDSLAALLHCLRAQDIEEPFEILICDDGSQRSALEASIDYPLLAELEIRYLWQSKRGHRAARAKNYGLQCARGNLIVQLDADILVREDFLRVHRAAHTAKRMVVCNPRKWILGSEFKAESGIPEQAAIKHGVARKLRELSSTDRKGMFDLLERISVEVERTGQKSLFISPYPWMACLGFSFSYDAVRGGCLFDENFVGWGPEDREFALRLWKRHGYSFRYCDEIVVYHVEACSTGRVPFVPLPKRPLQIEQYLKNMLYFRDRYPNEDLSHILRSLLAYRLSPQGDHWELHGINGSARASNDVVEAHSMEIRRWLKRQSIDSNVNCSS